MCIRDRYYAAYYYRLWHLSVLDALAEPGGHVLGDVQAREVQFGPDGGTGPQEFELANPDLWSRGVGAHTVAWRWEFRLEGAASWTTFETTRHRVFTVLDVPNAPWEQTPYTPLNTQLPWTDVLELACRWAEGSNDPATAAARIAAAVNRLGGPVFQYGCPVGGLTQY